MPSTIAMQNRVRRPHLIDAHVGSRIRLRRKMLGLSLVQLGPSPSSRFRNTNTEPIASAPAGLHDLSLALDEPVSFFFDDMDPVRAPAIPAGFDEAFGADPLRQPETVELVGAYYRIDDPRVRQCLFELLRAFASPAVAHPAGIA